MTSISGVWQNRCTSTVGAGTTSASATASSVAWFCSHIMGQGASKKQRLWPQSKPYLVRTCLASQQQQPQHLEVCLSDQHTSCSRCAGRSACTRGCGFLPGVAVIPRVREHESSTDRGHGAICPSRRVPGLPTSADTVHICCIQSQTRCCACARSEDAYCTCGGCSAGPRGCTNARAGGFKGAW